MALLHGRASGPHALVAIASPGDHTIVLTYSLLYLLAAPGPEALESPPAPETLETAQARIDAARAQNARQAESKLVAKTKRVDTYACAKYPDGRLRYPARCERRMNKVSQKLAEVDPDPPPPVDALDAAQQRLDVASELVDAAEMCQAELSAGSDATVHRASRGECML